MRTEYIHVGINRLTISFSLQHVLLCGVRAEDFRMEFSNKHWYKTISRHFEEEYRIFIHSLCWIFFILCTFVLHINSKSSMRRETSNSISSINIDFNKSVSVYFHTFSVCKTLFTVTNYIEWIAEFYSFYQSSF